MYFIGANVFVSIGTTVNPVILAAILIITGFSFWHIGRALDKLVIYGCSRGFSNKLKDVLAHPNSAELVERLYEGRSNTTESDKLVEGLASRVPVDKEDKHKHGLLYDLIRRFISRPIQNLDNQLSLQALSVEFASIAEIRERIDKARSLSSILPAVGLFGTLIGMFCAFVGADFQNPNMQLVMNELMKNFGMALWTTILAIIFKIALDLWCSLKVQREMSILTTELIQLKYNIFDIVEQFSIQSKTASINIHAEEPDLVYIPKDSHKTEEHEEKDIGSPQKSSE